MTKADALLGFRPRVGYREGLGRTLAWMREERLLPAPPSARARSNTKILD
jgi:hypothetical protein